LLFKPWLSINLVHNIAGLPKIRLVRATLLGYYNFLNDSFYPVKCISESKQ